MQGIQLTYETAVNGVGNYLSAKVEGEINHYQMKMLENNKIPGLLAARGSMFNGTYCIHYEIDGMRRLDAVLLGGGLSGKQAKNFMGDLFHSLLGLGEYFLSYMQCLLDTDYIYVDYQGRANLVYLPVLGQPVTSEETVRRFCQKLFAEYFTEDGNSFFLGLLRYASMKDFTLSGLIARFEEEKENSDVKEVEVHSVGQKVWQEPKPLPLVEAAEKKSPKSPGSQPGFAVPGGGLVIQEEKKEKKEKGGGLLKSLLGGRKDREQEKKSGKIEKPGKSETSREVCGEAAHSAGRSSRGGEPGGGTGAGGGWSGTVILGGEAAAGTVIMGMGGMPYLLYEGRKVEIGHFPFTVGKENTDFIINKNVISRSHIRILCREDDYFIVDENSKNHTWLNGRRITPYTETLLKDGDTLRLANEILTFHI